MIFRKNYFRLGPQRETYLLSSSYIGGCFIGCALLFLRYLCDLLFKKSMAGQTFIAGQHFMAIRPIKRSAF